MTGIELGLPDYITLFSISCLLGIYLSVKTAERHGIPIQNALNALLCVVVFGIVGARAYYCFQHFSFFYSYPWEVLALWKGGLASYGGFAGGALAGMAYLRRAKISIATFADCCVPFVAMGISLTRIGCFFNGCCFGRVSDIPWAVRFPKGSGPYIQQLLNGQLTGGENLSLPVHPAQIYDSLAALGLFLLLMAARRHTAWDGRLSLGFAAMYALSRFGIELYRGDISRGFAGVLSLPQVLSLIAFISAGLFLVLKLRKRGFVSATS